MAFLIRVFFPIPILGRPAAAFCSIDSFDSKKSFPITTARSITLPVPTHVRKPITL